LTTAQAAAAKGLFAGALTISKEADQVIDGRASQEVCGYGPIVTKTDQ